MVPFSQRVLRRWREGLVVSNLSVAAYLVQLPRVEDALFGRGMLTTLGVGLSAGLAWMIARGGMSSRYDFSKVRVDDESGTTTNATHPPVRFMTISPNGSSASFAPSVRASWAEPAVKTLPRRSEPPVARLPANAATRGSTPPASPHTTSPARASTPPAARPARGAAHDSEPIAHDSEPTRHDSESAIDHPSEPPPAEHPSEPPTAPGYGAPLLHPSERAMALAAAAATSAQPAPELTPPSASMPPSARASAPPASASARPAAPAHASRPPAPASLPPAPSLGSRASTPPARASAAPGERASARPAPSPTPSAARASAHPPRPSVPAPAREPRQEARPSTPPARTSVPTPARASMPPPAPVAPGPRSTAPTARGAMTSTARVSVRPEATTSTRPEPDESAPTLPPPKVPFARLPSGMRESSPANDSEPPHYIDTVGEPQLTLGLNSSAPPDDYVEAAPVAKIDVVPAQTHAESASTVLGNDLLNQLDDLRAEVITMSPSSCFVLGVSSDAAHAEAKSALSVELARSLAQSGSRRVLLIEADATRPALDRQLALHVPLAMGFSQQMHRRLTAVTPTWTVLRIADTLDVLAEGKFRTPGMLYAQVFALALSELRAYYDVIVADGPVVETSEAARAFASAADGIAYLTSRTLSAHEPNQPAFERFQHKRLFRVLETT